MRRNKLTRAEQNKEVRRIFSSHSVDLEQMQVSCSGTRISLYGSLYKRNGESFSHETMSTLLNELEKYGRVHSELTNWDLNSGVRKLEKANFSYEEEESDEYVEQGFHYEEE